MPKPLFVSAVWHAPPAAALSDVAGRPDPATSRPPVSNTTPRRHSLHAVMALFAGMPCDTLASDLEARSSLTVLQWQHASGMQLLGLPRSRRRDDSLRNQELVT